ncbi:hypothetical protein CesoFtcFv8_002849 [Champsocephalus esox]|uniref:Uncharacterized protein n=1 Tax=Champsocephalus esox TaxID=159716 RepID=A0AAN8HF22_9TELE|nr:hypothetical protein CesoFtcFv8_002849 [Champsocephalus esox]
MAAWLLSAAADGTQRHWVKLLSAPSQKYLFSGGWVGLHLPQQMSEHVGEEAAVFGVRMHFCWQEVT